MFLLLSNTDMTLSALPGKWDFDAACYIQVQSEDTSIACPRLNVSPLIK